MKVLNLIIAIYFIYYINCQTATDYKDYCGYEESSTSVDDCKNRKVSKEGSKCCYTLYSKKEKEGWCTTLDKYELDNFGKVMKKHELDKEIYEDDPESQKRYEEYGDYHIDCFSEYIKISLISILLILF